MKLRRLALTLCLFAFVFSVASIFVNNFHLVTKKWKVNLNKQVLFQANNSQTTSRKNTLWLQRELHCGFSNSNRIETNLVNHNNQSYADLTTDEAVFNIALDCSNLHSLYEFNLQSKPYKYDSYPIAYVIQIHQNIHQVMLLLSAIYTTDNVYCIHLDGNASPLLKNALNVIVECFPNVFISSKIENIVYASIRRLQADINCMKDLLAIPKTMYSWKYLINLCGQDFPLRNNDEIIEQLILLKNRNNVAGDAGQPNKEHVLRTQFKHLIEYDETTKSEKLAKTNIKHDPPPFNMTIRKNLAYNVYTRDFLQWALIDSDVGQALLKWSYETYSPDEHFWLMLNSYPSAPGGSPYISWWAVTPFIIWNNPNKTCGGYWRNTICVFGMGDLDILTSTNKLFANKFDVKKDGTVLKCLKQWIANHSTSSVKPQQPQDTFFQTFP